MNKKMKTLLKVLVPLGFGILILWLLYRNMDTEALLSTLKSDARFGVIFVGCLFGTLGNTIRGLRWQQLNKRLDPNVRLINSILTVHGNYGVSLALPRMGEVWRVATMAHYSGIAVAQLVGTFLIDRIYDIIALVVLLLIGILVNAPFFREFISTNPQLVAWWSGLLYSPWFYIIVTILVALLIGLVVWLGRSQHGKRVLSHLLEGIRTLASLQDRWLFYLYTVGIWGCYFLQFYICFWAFSFTQDLAFSAGLLGFVMAGIGVMVPTQGGMGGWHFVVIYTLMAFGVESIDAQSFALIVHTSQAIIWTGLVGLTSALLLPLVNRKKEYKVTR